MAALWLAATPHVYSVEEHASDQDHDYTIISSLGSAERSERSNDDGQDHARLFQLLVNHEGYWDYSLLARLFALSPEELLAFFDQDEILVREDARNVIRNIHDWCILALASAREDYKSSHEDERHQFRDKWIFRKIGDSANAGWCSALADEPDAYARMRQLIQLIDESNVYEQDYYTLVEQQIKEASDLEDLREFLLGSRMDLAISALYELRIKGDTSIIRDWSVLDRFSPEQGRDIFQYLQAGLECQHLRNCMAQTSPPISALCLRLEIDCGPELDFNSIMRRNLSPAQFDALMMLMSEVNTYRYQHGG